MNRFITTLASFIILFFLINWALAVTGTIDIILKYAWANQIGWINLGPTDGKGDYIGLQITDSAVTGYAWSQSSGWINFNPNNGGVGNDTSGNLSGYAWGENTGWINFSGVRINCSGQFEGTAQGDIAGTINFDCPNCQVSTNWRPSSGCGSHNECSQGQCVLVSGTGIDQCQGDSDCTSEVHNECSQGQCVLVDGPGFDQCQTGVDCNVSHNECSQGQCISVVGIGVNQCQSDSDCIIEKHNECDNQGRCIVVDGSGSDQCQSDNDCGATLIKPEEPIDEIIERVTENIVEPVTENIKTVVEEAKRIINSPTGSVVTRTITTTGAVVTTAVTLATALGATAITAITVGTSIMPSLFEIFLSLVRLWGIILTGFGIKKRIKYWGIAYDSVTKQPLDPAQVILQDRQGKEIVSAITDIDGRYGFLVQPGIYQIIARKTNYSFPSQKLAGENQDEIYNNLYFGQPIEIKSTGEVITKNIPLDPIKFDWNEFAKKNKTFMKFYSRWDLAFRKITDFFYIVGFLVAIVAFFATPYPYNTIILAIYLVLLLLRIFGLKPKSFGYIIDKTTSIPLSFAIVRVVSTFNVEISHKVADVYGRYYCLVPKGKYYVKIEKKNNDGSYSLVHTSEIIDVSRKGIIKKKFIV